MNAPLSWLPEELHGSQDGADDAKRGARPEVRSQRNRGGQSRVGQQTNEYPQEDQRRQRETAFPRQTDSGNAEREDAEDGENRYSEWRPYLLQEAYLCRLNREDISSRVERRPTLHSGRQHKRSDDASRTQNSNACATNDFESSHD